MMACHPPKLCKVFLNPLRHLIIITQLLVVISRRKQQVSGIQVRVWSSMTGYQPWLRLAQPSCLVRRSMDGSQILGVTPLKTRALNCNKVSFSPREMVNGVLIRHRQGYCSRTLTLTAPIEVSRCIFSIQVSQPWSPMPGLSR